MFVMLAGSFQLVLMLLTMQTTMALRVNQSPREAPAESELYFPMFTYEEYRGFEVERKRLILNAQDVKHAGTDEAKPVYIDEILPTWNRMRSCIMKGTTPISYNDSGKLIMETTFPNSGTSITHSMSRRIAGWNNAATVYNQELGGHGHLVPGTGNVYIQDTSPIDDENVMGKALVKSHCQGYAFDRPAPPYKMSLADCVNLRDDHLLAGTLRVHRNPLDNLVARFHLEQKAGRTNATDSDFQGLFNSLKPDLRVHMRWLVAANGFLSNAKVEVLWYEDLLADPNSFAQNVARIIGVTEDRRSDKAINWEDKIFHREELQYVGNDLLPVYLHMYTPEMIHDVSLILQEEFALWADC